MIKPQIIPVLERTMALLQAVADSEGGLSAKHLSLQLGIPSATCYRILRTLVRGNWLSETSHGTYCPAFALALLTRNLAGVEQHVRELQPLMQKLSEETNLSVKVSLCEGRYAVTVARSESLRPNSITSPVGSKIPLLEAGSAGLVLMATLSPDVLSSILKGLDSARQKKLQREITSVRRENFAHSYGVHHPSIYAMSIPINLGQPGALTLVGWPGDFVGKKKRVLEEKLKEVLKP